MSQQINLYHSSFRKQEKRFSAQRLVPALFLVLAGLVALYAYLLVQVRGAERLAVEHARQEETQRQQLADLSTKLSPQAQNKALATEVERLDAELRARQALLEMLGTGELGNTTGFSEFFAALGRQTVSGVWLVGLSLGESGNQMQLQGRALRPELVPAYLKALRAEPVMQGRQVTELKLIAKSAGPATTAKAPSGPVRYVEFAVSAPLHAAAGDASAAKGGTP